MTDLPVRSALFVPSGNPRAMARASALTGVSAPDVLIFDLEDAVDPAAFVAALTDLGRRLDLISTRAQVWVRIRPDRLDETICELGFHLSNGGIAALVVPKAETSDDLMRVREALMGLEAGAVPPVVLWAMIETPAAVTGLDAILRGAKAAGLKGLILGPNDLRRGLMSQPMPGRADLITAILWMILQGRAHGLSLLDGVYNAYQDRDGFIAEARQGRDFGFDGKTLIHPSQIALANQAFGPSEAEITRARAIIDTFAANPGAAVIALEGEMFERMHLEQAWACLAHTGLASPGG